jgi:lipopolysaccharide cholinephosphotransferase
MDTLQTQIQQVWQVEQEILDAIHQVCTAHNLRYSLAYGTLIGAIRHGGFIPWDDDIDLVMPREDYEKLVSIWNDAAPAGYIMQNVQNSPDYTNNFAKIRKNHTTFLQNESEREKQYHKGIFVDIFPGDRVASGKLTNKLQYIACAVDLLFCRGFSSGSGGMVGAIERLLLALPKGMRPGLRNASEKIIQNWNGKNDKKLFFPSTIEYAKHYYSADLFENMGTITFCGKEYSCVADPDAFLRADYGDYMQLPPEEERMWKHHPIIIDLEHNYEEIVYQ